MLVHHPDQHVERMAELHDCMPEQRDWLPWLGEVEGDHAALLRLAADGLLRTWPVGRRVGSPKNNAPECGKQSLHRLPEAAVS
jgi:putative SOS response-associated peptidase YedK